MKIKMAFFYKKKILWQIIWQKVIELYYITNIVMWYILLLGKKQERNAKGPDCGVTVMEFYAVKVMSKKSEL